MTLLQKRKLLDQLVIDSSDIDLSQTPVTTSGKDDQTVYFIDPSYVVVKHFERLIGFENYASWIDGICGDLDLGRYAFCDVYEAIDFCLVFMLLEGGVNSQDPDTIKWALCKHEELGKFWQARMLPDRVVMNNINPALKPKRFDPTSFFGEEQYNLFVSNLIEQNKERNQMLSDPDVLYAQFINDQIEARKEARKQKMQALKEKLSPKHRRQERDKEFQEAIGKGIVEGIFGKE